MPSQLPHWDSLAATSRLFSHPLSIPFSPHSLWFHHSVFLSGGGKVVQIKFLSSSRAEPSILSHLHLYMYTYCENGLPLPLHLISEESQMYPGVTAHTGMLMCSNFPLFHCIFYYSRDIDSHRKKLLLKWSSRNWKKKQPLCWIESIRPYPFCRWGLGQTGAVLFHGKLNIKGSVKCQPGPGPLVAMISWGKALV